MLFQYERMAQAGITRQVRGSGRRGRDRRGSGDGSGDGSQPHHHVDASRCRCRGWCGWLDALVAGMTVGGATGGLLGALTNAGIKEEDAQVLVEGVRRGGTLVAARARLSERPRIDAIMDRSAVNLAERADLYRKSGWRSFDPYALPYTADQVRVERALHAH